MTNIKTMTEHLGIALFPPRMAASLLGVFGVVALLLAAIGIYGIMAYSVSRRTREIGIRIALGARRENVVGLVAGQGLILATCGILIGLAAALALTRFLSGMLYGVGTTDAVTFVGIPLLLGAVTVLASYIPARRAASVDPITARRYE